MGWLFAYLNYTTSWLKMGEPCDTFLCVPLNGLFRHAFSHQMREQSFKPGFGIRVSSASININRGPVELGPRMNRDMRFREKYKRRHTLRVKFVRDGTKNRRVRGFRGEGQRFENRRLIVENFRVLRHYIRDDVFGHDAQNDASCVEL